MLEQIMIRPTKMQESQVQVQIQGQRQRQQSSYGFRSGRPCCLNWASSAFLALLLLMASTTNILTSVEASTSPTSSITSKYIRKSDLTDMAQNKEWQSLSGNVQFLPSTKGGLTNQEQLQSWAARQLNAEPDGDDDIYRLSPLVEGETEYDEYQTAWRLLGFMIDCDDDLSDALYDDQYRSGSGDGGDGGTGEGCHRYVIWAAYVDLEYQGGGIGEYQYWDRWNQKWNANSCNFASNGGNRCAKMDCHLEDTHWSLLGIFKHQSLDDWMEQLFKHEGMCVWTDDEYDFMGDAREAWPEACMQSGTTTSDGGYIYYHVKPLSGGRITLGLYTDTRCVEEYIPYGSDDPITVENVVGNFLENNGSGDNNNNNNNNGGSSVQDSLEEWDSALETFRICNPCVAYDLNNVGYNADDDASKGSAYGTYRYGYDDDYQYNYYNVQGNDFDCYDDADYTNVNQCMKFMAKTEMNTASFRDIMLANAQGTLVGNPFADYIDQRKGRGWLQRRRNSTNPIGMYFWFFCSVALVGYAYYTFRKAQKSSSHRMPKFQWSVKEPLVFV